MTSDSNHWCIILLCNNGCVHNCTSGENVDLAVGYPVLLLAKGSIGSL